MKTKYPLTDEEFTKKYLKLTKPMFEANIAIMHSMLESPEIQNIIQEVRSKLHIPKKGRKPNTEKSFYQKVAELNISEGLILNHTVAFEERQILNEYVNKIIHDFDLYDHFKISLEIYIIHNLVSAPAHNVVITQKIKGDGKSRMPEVHFGKLPQGNDLKIFNLLLKRNKQILDHLPNKYKKLYRGSKNLETHLKVVKEASNRERTSEVDNTTFRYSNTEIAQDYLGDEKKDDTVKKILYRSKKRTKEITAHS